MISQRTIYYPRDPSVTMRHLQRKLPFPNQVCNPTLYSPSPSTPPQNKKEREGNNGASLMARASSARPMGRLRYRQNRRRR